jgi:iron complex transport system ATP-binding protein
MISINSISVSRGTATVIEDFSAEFKAGTITAIIGPNGSGKSTLLEAIAGDLPLTGGAISLNNKDLQSYQFAELAQLRSVVLQQPTFNLAFTVQEVLAMARIAGSSLKSETAAMAKLDINDLADRKVTQLSGGERQRVAIALAIAVDAPILLLDEPLAAQDVESTNRIIDLLKSEAKAGKTIILVAHVPESELSWCDQIIKNF